MNKILSVNFHIPTNDVGSIPYNSKASLSDADIILFLPTTNQDHHAYNAYWRNELLHVLGMGKTVFILLSKPFAKSYGFLPDSSLQIVDVIGIEVHPKSNLIEPLFKSLKSNWVAHCYLLGISIEQVLFSSKNNDRNLGAIFNTGKGHILLLPYLDIQSNPEKGRSLIKELSNIHNILNSKDEISERPDWANLIEFEIVSATLLSLKVENNIKTINGLLAENDSLLEKIKEKEIIKNLLFETGKQLENGVIHSLKILGYTAENYDDGVLELDQVILSPEGDRFIGECEGKDNKAIDITKFRQLQDALNEDFHREEINEKAYGILFGNPQRLFNPVDRTVDFTDKCKNGAKREMIGLVNTVDLFKVIRYLSENDNEEFKIKCRKAIKEQLGKVIQFPDLPE